MDDKIVEGPPPLPNERGELSFRVVHVQGGEMHKARLAIFRAGTGDMVWSDVAENGKLPLRAGRYDIRIDRLSGALMLHDIEIKIGETTRVELSTNTGALQIAVPNNNPNDPTPARLQVFEHNATTPLWTDTNNNALVELKASTYDVRCERSGHRGGVLDAKVTAGQTTAIRCSLR